MTPGRDDRARMLAALSEGCEGLIELRAFSDTTRGPAKEQTFVQFSDAASIEKFVALHIGEGLYVAVASRVDATSGKLENCCHLSAVFVDVDFKTTPESDARERLARFPWPVSIIVRSGGGLHLYWLLKEPIDLRTAEGRNLAYQLLRRLAAVLGGDMKAAEPARVLRLPGTLNHKPAYGAARPVVLELLEPARRYNVSELDDALPPETHTSSAGSPFVLPDQIPEGKRNSTLWSYGRSLKARRWKVSLLFDELERVNRERCVPPLSDGELADVVDNVMNEADRPTFTASRQNGQPGNGAAEGNDQRPEIDTGNLGLDEMAAEAWTAIERANAPPLMFLYAGTLAWLVTDATKSLGVEVMNQDHVRHHLADVAAFTKWSRASTGRPPEKKPAFPPVALAADLLAVPRATLPRLLRLVRMPVFTQDARLLTRPGFDSASGLYFAPPAGLTVPPVDVEPSPGDIAAAVEAICRDLLGDFPFVGEADLAHTVALLLTPLLREMVAGSVPLFVVSKPTPRTGAGLLAKVVSIVQTGAPIPASTISRDEEEMRKRLTALLIPSPEMILLDNLHGRLDSPALAAILTTSVWTDRVLGRSQTLRLVVRSTFLVTGNNVSLSTEMAGRGVLIRLDPKIEDPSTRTDFLHPHLDEWAIANRERLLWAALVMGQAWIAAGRPMLDVAFGGFGEWAGVLGGVLKVVGIPGFLANRHRIFEQADEESAHVRAFFADWRNAHGDTPVLVKDLVVLAKNHPLPIASRSEQGILIRLGQMLQSLLDRQFNLGQGVMVALRRPGEYRRAALWQLAACESYESCESPPADVNTLARAPVYALTHEDSQDSHTHTAPPAGREPGDDDEVVRV